MDKPMGVLLMVIFGISGTGATALAWLLPALQLDKTEATLAGIIGIGFLVFQSLRLKRAGQNTGGEASFERQTEDSA
jgi:hypothetical protein